MIRYETPYSPADVDYDEGRLDILHRHFQKMIDAKELVLANYCLSRDGKIFANAAIGKLSYKEDDDRELKPDTIQWIASITKLFCAVAIFKLAEDGMLRLDQTVGEFIEEFKNPPFNKINIAHLLSHTSGMYPDVGAFENKYFKSPWYFIENMKEGENWIEAALSAGLYKEPGQEWTYCSFGYVILGEIITRVSGVFAEDYIMENIVKPLGLKDTGFVPTKEQIMRMNIPNEYREKRIKFMLSGEKKESKWDKIPSTGGGMFSTAWDLNIFGTMLLNNGTYEGIRILGRKAVEKMTSFHLTGDIKDYCWNAGGVPRLYGLGPDMRYNLATFYTKGSYFHEGAGACCLLIDPYERLVASWFVPFRDYAWYPHALFNVAAIIWSGLK